MTLYRKLTLLCVCMVTGTWAQTFTIPDPAFAAYLQAVVPNAITGNVLSTEHPDVLGLTFINVGYSGITDLSGVQYFTALEQLSCHNNDLTSLPTLPQSLWHLGCSDNQLVALPTLHEGLLDLYADNNQLTSLPELPSTLTTLVCSSNLLTTLPALGPNIVDLQCRQNQLTALPELPNSLLQLVCNNNLLITLPTLPLDLYFLDCSFNQITDLPALPNELEWIYVQENLLTTLVNIPDSAVMLRCDHNLLSSLPSMANSALHILMCWNNQLTELPELPPTLGQFWCHTNPLKCFPWLPNSLYNLNCTNTPTTCLPNIPASLDTSSFWAPFPLEVCDVTRSDCAIREETISGVVFNDLDADGIRDIDEPPFLLAQVEAQPGNFLTAPDPNGSYVLHVDTGTYVVNGQPVLYHQRTTPSWTSTLVQYGSDTLRDIGYRIIPDMYDVVADLVAGIAQPGFLNPITLGVRNVGTEATTATIAFTHSPLQLWNSSDLTPVTLIGNVATWTADLEPGELWSTRVYLRTDSTVALGTAIDHSLSASIPQEDQTPENNTDSDPGVVLGSFDPNDKRVSPEELTPEQLMGGARVEYTIRFQNTGTFPAQRVVITDTLRTDLVHSSLQFHSSSHPCSWYLAHGVLYVIHDPIFLPDSTTDEPRSHGHVRFTIKPSALLLVGDRVENTANIFFDFNSAVITEPADFIIQSPTSIAQIENSEILAYPDPFTTEVTIYFEEPFTTLDRLEFIDALGRVLRTAQGNGSHILVLPRGELSNGVYFVQMIRAGGKKAVVRLVAE